MYRLGTSYTALYSCFNWLKSVPTRYQLHSLCTAYPTPNWLQSHPTQSIQHCVDSGAGRQLVSKRYGVNRLVTESTDQPHSLLHINRLQSLPITNQHQESPTQRSSTSWPLLISSLFTGLRLMTGLIMYSPRQEVFSYTKTASTGYRAHQPVTGYTVFTEQFASHQLVTVYRPSIMCNFCLASFQYWLQRTGTDQQTHLGITYLVDQ